MSTRDPLLDFSGLTALITGAASGFGAGLARELGNRGARLALGDVNADGLDTVAGELREAGHAVVAQRCDVSRETDARTLVEAAVAEFGTLDIAVNNAGIAPPMTPLEYCDDTMLDAQLAVNLKGVFYGMKHQAVVMKKQDHGNILNVSSMAGLGAAPGVSTYSAAKHAVIGLTRTAAVEMASFGIRVNAVCPFFTLTPMVTEIVPPEGKTTEQQQAFLATGCPMKRLAEPDEVIAAMVMLCSPALSYLNGQALAVDGGFSAM